MLQRNRYRGYELKEEGGRVHVIKDGEAKGNFAGELEATQFIDSTETQAGRKPEQSTAAEPSTEAAPGEHAERSTPGQTADQLTTR